MRENVLEQGRGIEQNTKTHKGYNGCVEENFASAGKERQRWPDKSP